MIHKKDLADAIYTPSRAGEVMYCPACGAEYSANAGDYWNMPDSYEFKCECGSEMILGSFKREFITK